MPSSKGEPDNPKLREEVKQEVKNLEKGGGKGSWSAWKAGELARRYEAKGGGYKDTGDNKNKAKKGVPERKDGKEWGGKGFQKKEKNQTSDDDDDNNDKNDDDAARDKKNTKQKNNKKNSNNKSDDDDDDGNDATDEEDD